MNRVATSFSYSSVLDNLMKAQLKAQQANEQVSSQKVANSLKGYANSAETLLATRTIQTRVQGFLDQSETLASKLDSQNLALTQVADAAGDAKQAIMDALANNRGEALMNQLSSLFASASESLNAKFGGRYLFAGGQSETTPVTAQKLSDLTAGPVANVFKNDGLKTVSRLDETSTIQTGFLADELGTGLFTAFRDVQAYVEANGPFTGQLTTAQANFLQGMLDDFDGARTSLTNAAAANGLLQNRVEKTIESQEARKLMLDGLVGGITDANMPKAISELEKAQVAVQASAQVFNSLSQSSLLGLLK
ncbi:flagellin [Caulobacter mirabilis]|uniref:Flagellin n=1 Tax=Caulobacter mirabilis TaxID=69666 RepID=A0A2D2AV12_9CAUL|nr:flagellin [Caulobacter mirabilis]ATQ41838.1 flagellin [Caulobacter mirabilis]